MFALLVLAGFTSPVVLLLVLDQRKLQHRRSVERGLHLVSERASHRLQFRRPVQSDLSFFLEMAADPVAADANGWRADEGDSVRSRFNDKAQFERLRENEIVAFERKSSIRVGTATFSMSPLDPAGTRAIGVHVHPHHRNQGYGREIMAAAILLMQYTPGPIQVGTRVTNIGMQRIMHQLGYQAEPDSQPYTAPNGKTYPAYWYNCGAEVHPPAGLHELPRK